MRHACAGVASPSERDTICREKLDGLLLTEAMVGLSEHTLIEFHNSLATLWRDTGFEAVEYDKNWFEGSLEWIMRSIAEARVEVIAVPPKTAEHAMVLVTVATRDHGISFRAWDAYHLIVAANWAHTLGTAVTLCTTDAGFARFDERYSSFRKYVNIWQLDQ